MAHAERDAPTGLKIDTTFSRSRNPGWARNNGSRGTDGYPIEGDRTAISQGPGAECRDADGDSILSELHAETPPISVPRPDDHSTGVYQDIGFAHRPEDAQPSPLDSFLRARQSSISFNPEVTIDSGRRHTIDAPLGMPEARNRAYCRPPMRSSALRKAESRSDEVHHDARDRILQSGSGRRESQRPFPTGNSRVGFFPGPDDDVSVSSELDRPTSLTSISTASPFTEELRTPPEGSRDMIFPPFPVSSPGQRSASLDDPNIWSGAAATPFGTKPRSYTFDRNGSLRNSMRQRSRRSTGSSGKSPASAFLSMWSSREEPAPQPDDEGQMVGTDYVLGKRIGFGGFSTVKEAFKLEENGETRRLAVKIVRKNVAGKNERENDQVQAEFDHEVRVWRYLSHPHVLTLDAVYETDFATFCFTKLAIGGTLFDLVRANRRGLEMPLAKKYCYQLASAIRYLHEDARVVHRDIKLENCLLDPVESPDDTQSFNLVLCDFGMAEWMSADNGGSSLDPYDNAADRLPPRNIGPAVTSTNVAGSLEYAAPELLLSPGGVIDPAVDIWAFGVVAFAVVVGSRPFQDAFSPRVQSNILGGNWDRDAVLGDKANPVDLRDRQDALELIKGCLEMDPDKRWTIRDVLNSQWLREYADSAEATDTTWKL
ncbi:kinase-like domain-containing protein [Thermoascus aurantiacus ATCC 26904]